MEPNRLEHDMRVAKTDVIAGLPAEIARGVVRLFFEDGPAERAAVRVGREASERTVAALVESGYLEQSRVYDGIQTWRSTILGNALAQASFGKPISRLTANRLVASLIERSRDFNADPRYLLSVYQLRVFGSYLDEDVDRLGDVDIELKSARRYVAGNRADVVTAYARASGRSFGTFLDELSWPERELRLFLKNRSTALNITTENISRFTDRARLLYSISEDRDALPTLAPGDDDA